MPAHFFNTVLETLHERHITRVLRAGDDQDRPVILKSSRLSASARDVENYCREYSIMRSLQRLPGVMDANGLNDSYETTEWFFWPSLPCQGGKT